MFYSQFEWYRECRFYIYTRLKAKALRRVFVLPQRSKNEFILKGGVRKCYLLTKYSTRKGF